MIIERLQFSWQTRTCRVHKVAWKKVSQVTTLFGDEVDQLLCIKCSSLLLTPPPHEFQSFCKATEVMRKTTKDYLQLESLGFFIEAKANNETNKKDQNMNNFILQYGKIGSYYLHNDYQVCHL